MMIGTRYGLQRSLDQLQAMPILSRADFESVKALRPHTGINDHNRPDSLNGNMTIGKPIRSTINNFLAGGRR